MPPLPTLVAEAKPDRPTVSTPPARTCALTAPPPKPEITSLAPDPLTIVADAVPPAPSCSVAPAWIWVETRKPCSVTEATPPLETTVPEATAPLVCTSS